MHELIEVIDCYIKFVRGRHTLEACASHVGGILSWTAPVGHVIIMDAMRPHIRLLCGRGAGFGLIVPPLLEVGEPK
jgi:hypothetical protein